MRQCPSLVQNKQTKYLSPGTGSCWYPWTSNLQNFEKINCSCFSYFVQDVLLWQLSNYYFVMTVEQLIRLFKADNSALC